MLKLVALQIQHALRKKEKQNATNQHRRNLSDKAARHRLSVSHNAVASGIQRKQRRAREKQPTPPKGEEQ